MSLDSGYIFKLIDKLICPNREPNLYFDHIKEATIYDPGCSIFIIQV